MEPAGFRKQPKTQFFAMLSTIFLFSFSMLKHARNHLNKHQAAKTDGFKAISANEKRFPDNSGQIACIAMADIYEIMWYNHRISFISVIAIHTYLARIARKTLSNCTNRFVMTTFCFLLLVWMILCMFEHWKRK
jgi:uncharacterized membrane protein